jgi:hypothetical protein
MSGRGGVLTDRVDCSTIGRNKNTKQNVPIDLTRPFWIHIFVGTFLKTQNTTAKTRGPNKFAKQGIF